MHEDCPLFLKPRLRLFLSADIVGSTALKQSQVSLLREDSKNPSAPWFFIIQGFYIEAKVSFLAEWKRASAASDSDDLPLGDDPLIWKTIGDEILFTKVLTDYRQPAFTLKCWIVALGKIRHFLKTRDARLDVKSTAWLAGFPVKNKDVVLSNSPELLEYKDDNYLTVSGNLLNKYYADPSSDEVAVDFVGPSVDIGFRLASHSTGRRFVVSVGIPYIISLSTPKDDDFGNEIKFRFGGTVSLKGVFGGLPYPIFWIDMGEDNTSAKLEDAFFHEKDYNARDVQKYCAAFYGEQSAYTFKPFIYEEGEHKLKKAPPWYDAQLGKLIREFNHPSTAITDGEDPAIAERPRKKPKVKDIIAGLSVAPPTDDSTNDG